MEKYIYRLIKSSALAAEIDGNVYRHGMRPRDAKSEDIEVRLISGNIGQCQQGEVEIVVYVPQMSVGSRTNKVDDLARIQWICDMVRLTIDEHGNPRIHLCINSEPKMKSLPEAKQTQVKVKLEYSFVNH
ncbi:MAG: hypothetical protein IKH26_12125 [Bacteroidaceae bacterium]|nr:hypothetical protein [Bacteroidaceae bacterium]